MRLKIKVVYFANTSSMYGDNIALLNIIEDLQDSIIPYFITGQKGDFTDVLEKKGYPYYLIPFRINLYPQVNSIRDFFLFLPRLLRTYIQNAFCLIKSIKIVRTIKPNLIHTNNGLINEGFLTAKKLKIKHIWHIREYGILDVGQCHFPSNKAFSRMISSKDNYSIAITKGIFDYFKMTNNAKVIYDGVFKSSLSEVFNEKKKYFLFVGRLCEAKGIEALIDAFLEFSEFDNSYSLIIVGNGEEKYLKKIHKTIFEYNKTSKIRFVGYSNQVDTYMREATALIVPSRFEGFGLITAEAMVHGCLVIGNNTAGTKEQFDNGYAYTGQEIGIRYSGHNELVASLKQITTNEIDYYFPILNRASATAMNLYSSKNNSSKVLKLYECLISEF